MFPNYSYCHPLCERQTLSIFTLAFVHYKSDLIFSLCEKEIQSMQHEKVMQSMDYELDRKSRSVPPLPSPTMDCLDCPGKIMIILNFSRKFILLNSIISLEKFLKSLIICISMGRAHEFTLALNLLFLLAVDVPWRNPCACPRKRKEPQDEYYGK